MNLKEIKNRVYGRDCEEAYDKLLADRNWLITEIEKLQEDKRQLIDTCNALSV